MRIRLELNPKSHIAIHVVSDILSDFNGNWKMSRNIMNIQQY